MSNCIAVRLGKAFYIFMPEAQKIIDTVEQGSFGKGDHKNDLFEKVISLGNLFWAWDRFLKGKRNKLDVQLFARHLEVHIFDLHEKLKNNVWAHGLYDSFVVCDPKARQIHKASVADRIFHHAVVDIIEPIFDKTFIYDSWSCRSGKGTHKAISRFEYLLQKLSKNNRQEVWILKCDIRKYFQSVDQEILLKLISKQIKDPRLMALLKDIICSFSPGLPLGNLTSQLFANVYLNPLDHFVKERMGAPVYLRYCDDFILAHNNKEWLKAQIPVLTDFLMKELHLTLHPQKMHLRPWHWGVDWLGFRVYPDHRVLRHKTRKRFKKNILKNVDRYLDGEIDYEDIQPVLGSYLGLLKHGSEGDYIKHLLVLWKCV